MSQRSLPAGLSVVPAQGSARWRTGVRIAFAIMGAAVLAYLGLLLARPTGSDSTLIDGWCVDGFELLAGLLCLTAGGPLHRTGADWRGRSVVPLALGAGILCWASGDVVTTIESLGGAPPVPSAADAFYLSFFPLCYLALAIFVRRQAQRMSAPLWLDGAVAGLGAAAVCAAFAFAAVQRTTHESGLAVAVNLAYPVGDVLLLLLVGAGTVLVDWRRRGPWLLLALGITVNVLGDTANLLPGALAGGRPAWILNAIAWPASSLLMAMAMWLRDPRPNPLLVRRPAGFVLPALTAGAGVGVLFARTLVPVDPVATGLATATLVLVVLRTWVSVRQLRSQSHERHLQSLTDHLTGLANRRRLFDVLETALGARSASGGSGQRLAFLFIDLNGFKQVNDSFGHPVGDEILRRVGARLSSALRSPRGGSPGPHDAIPSCSDLLARVGGDEFAAVVFEAEREQAEAVAHRLAACLQDPFQIDSVSARIGASIGLAMAPEDAGESDALMWCADVAMYRAKLTGTPVAVYEPALDGGGDRLRLADELRSAIDSSALVLHYQPQLDLTARQVTTVEALVRWSHPQLGLIPPLTFLPLAEEAGLMGRVTRWVLDQALEQCARWRQEGRVLRMSVNITARDLLDPGFCELIWELLARHELAPESLVLEITETSIIDEFEHAREVVGRLRARGIEVSIDDFGAGFTSLAYLNHLEVGELKLDRRFISPLAGAGNARDADLVRAVIDLGHALGLRVVAEGVEDAAALALLRRLGCDLAQGYGIGRPVPAGELRAEAPADPGAAASEAA